MNDNEPRWFIILWLGAAIAYGTLWFETVWRKKQ